MNTVQASPCQLRQHVGITRELVSSSHSISVPGWAVSSSLGIRSRTSRRVFELEIVCAPAFYVFSVIAGLTTPGNKGVQPDNVELEVKFVLAPVVWR